MNHEHLVKQSHVLNKHLGINMLGFVRFRGPNMWDKGNAHRHNWCFVPVAGKGFLSTSPGLAGHPEGLVPATAAYTQNAYGADPEAGP